MSPSANPLAQGKTGKGTAIPTTGSAGSVNINAILAAMVSRDIWTYYYTLKLASGTTFAPSYGLFNQYISQPDPYPLAAASPAPILTKVETNMLSQSGQGFTAPRDLILNRIGFYFLPGASGNNSLTEGIGLQSNVNDMFAFCQYSYFEFKIIEKIFIEGYLELQPPGVGFAGFSSVQNTSIVTLGWSNPHATNKMGDFAKYLAPQMPWSLTIYFPSNSGPITSGGTVPASGALLTSSAGGRGLWLKTNLTGLTDRAVQ
jgi:hypothetical protein